MSAFKITPEARRFLFSHARSHAPTLVLIFFAGAVTAFLEVTGVGLVFPLLTIIMRPDAIDAMPGMRRLVDAIGANSQKELIIVLSAAIAITMALKNVYMTGFYYWQARLIARWKAELSRRMMRLYLLSDFRLHMEKSASVMIRNLSLSGIVFDQYIIALLNLMTNGTVAAGIALLLFYALPGPTAFGIGTLAVAATAVFVLTRDRLIAIGQESNEIYRLRSILLQQSIGAIRESKILGREDFFLDQFGAIEHRSFDRQGRYTFLSSLPALGLETVIVFSMLAVVVHVMFIAGGGPTGLATIGLLAAAMFRMLPMVTRIIVNLQLLNFGKSSLELVAKEINDCEHRVRVTRVGAQDKLKAWRQIELRDVGYTYPNGTRALHGITAVLRRNEFVGITGPSGSGKSTLMMILLGLVEPTEGEVCVDGASLKDATTLRKWQNGIGYVPQGLFLVDGSLAENVAFGDPNPDLERVRRVLEAAQLGEYVDHQPQGIHESVGEYGERLSGGQKQRVVIARALYRNPDLIAFDEATAALDAQSEKAIADYLLQFKAEKTLLAIAHRLSTIMHCDQIMFLERGRLSGFGPFAALREESTSFRELARLSNL